MLFDIVHRTDYRYGHPASEACLEARLTPPSLPTQEVVSHRVEFQPAGGVSTYTDYFGNAVTFLSLARSHREMSATNFLRVRTVAVPPAEDALALPVADARQILSSRLPDIFDYLQPTSAVPTGGPAKVWARKFLSGARPLRDALESLNAAIHRKFSYVPGATENSTPLAKVWKNREGVCQDFAHIMLSVLRTAGLPARYVCGYIESGGPDALVGSMATHAWVEALLPGMNWVGFDPTNDQPSGERHVAVSYGRDFSDAAPVRGTFKGSGQQRMSVKVRMKRVKESFPRPK